MTSILTRTLIAAGLALGLSGAALADNAVFRYKDLDLSTEAGRAELEKRIDAVVRQACPGESATGTRIESSKARAECMADVRRQISARMAARTTGGSSSR